MIKIIETQSLFEDIGKITSKTIKFLGITIYTKVLSDDALHLKKIQQMREKHHQKIGR